jgi:hypothetical protein
MHLIQEIIFKLLKVLFAPGMIGIGLMTLLIWGIMTFMPYYSNHNFDLALTIMNYIMYFSIGCFVTGIVVVNSVIVGTSAISLSMTILSLLLIKNISLSIVGHMVFVPLSIFCFFVLMKNSLTAVVRMGMDALW